MTRFPLRLRQAWAGVRYAVRTELHMRIHCIAGGLAGLVLFFFPAMTMVEWLLFLMVSSMVLIAELFNTAVEAVVDLVSPGYHPLAKAAKDVAAGAVLVAAISSVAVGCGLLLPQLCESLHPLPWLQGLFVSSWLTAATLALWRALPWCMPAWGWTWGTACLVFSSGYYGSLVSPVGHEVRNFFVGSAGGAMLVGCLVWGLRRAGHGTGWLLGCGIAGIVGSVWRFNYV